ncbi:MAG: alpha amylase N-terminal ig-like domain-containing protein [Clostridiales bacterium]|nr:alpha amylase N-terminal ig-like domain-containing protein [Clostridiales bacterium]
MRVNAYFEESDIFHDQGAQYMTPLEPKGDEDVTLRLKTRYGSVTEAAVYYTFEVSGTQSERLYHRAPMTFERADENRRFEYWIGIVPANEACYKYHFELRNRRETVYYNADGLSDVKPVAAAGDYYVMPDFSTPDWSKGALWYSIMPESFYNGNTLNDKTGAGWDTAWGNTNSWAGEWFGGDLLGIMQKLDYLNGLNITSLFLNPIWVTAHNAGYGSYDLHQIDPSLGNDDLFLEFVNGLHDDEMKIMLDAVFEYCNINNVIYNSTKLYPYLGGGLEAGDPYYNVVQRDENGDAVFSHWGSPLFDFSKEIARKYIYSEEESVMLTYILKYAVDGWRMDVGNTLRGSDPDNWGTPTQILKDIRKYIKEIGDDILYLSEHADANHLTDYILDTKWNYGFQYPTADWVSGVSNAAVLANSLEEAVLGLPRSVANSSYNFLTTHDQVRLFDQLNGDVTKFGAAQLLLMTYVGAPCIYFGEETGLLGAGVLNDDTALSFFNAFNWDESTWNYYVYNLTKALTELRTEYRTVFKDGAYMNLFSDGTENPYDIYAYARFNEGGTVITAVNRYTETAKEFTLDIGKLSLKDGAVLTDYLSGRKYVVKDGKVCVDVYPCGVVLVDGDAGNYRGIFKTEGVSGANGIRRVGESSYMVSGNAVFESDGFTYGYLPGFNNYAIDVKTTENDGAYALLIRSAEADGDLFGVSVTGRKVRSFFRRNGVIEYGATVEVPIGSRLRAARTDNGVCRVLIDSGDGFYEAAALRKKLNMAYSITLGFAPLYGTSELRDVAVTPLKAQIYADFEGSLSSAFFTRGQSEVKTDGGVLNIRSKDLRPAFALTRAPMVDFTEKAMLSFGAEKPGDMGGMVVAQSENDFIFAGRKNIGGISKIVLSHHLNGAEALYAESNDTSEDFLIQIEKVATSYRALISTDGGVSFAEIGRVSLNYSNIYAGLCVGGGSELTASYWCFGDAVNGKDGYAAHYSAEDMVFDMREYADSDFIHGYDVSDSGSWSYIKGGILQNGVLPEKTFYSFTGAALGSFKAVFTLSVKDMPADDAYVGLIFGRPSASAEVGTEIHIDRTGTIRLLNEDGTVLAERGISDFKFGKQYQLTLSVNGSTLLLYVGERPELLLRYGGFQNKKGYFAWQGYKASYAVCNYGVFAESGNWSILKGEMLTGENEFNPQLTDIEFPSGASNYAALRKRGYSDFAVAFNLQLIRTNAVLRGYFDYHIGTKSGGNNMNDGLILRFDDRGYLTLIADGEMLTRNEEIGIDVGSCYLVIVYQNQILKLFAAAYEDGKTEYGCADITEIFTYQDARLRSGAPAFYTQNCGVRLNAIRGRGLSDGAAAEQTSLFGEIYISEPLPPEPEIIGTPAAQNYFNDFNEKRRLGDFARYSGSAEIRNGVLMISGAANSNWDAGAALANGTYSDFQLSVKLRMGEKDGERGFIGVEFHKNNPTGNHQGRALSIVMYPGGSAQLFIGNGILTDRRATGSPDADGWYTLTLTVQNGNVSFDLGNGATTVKIAELSNNNDLSGGYISLNAGNDIGYFDDLSIELFN